MRVAHTQFRKIPPLQILVMGLLGGLKSVFYILALLFLVFYIYAILGIFIFRENDKVRYYFLRFLARVRPCVFHAYAQTT